MYGTRPTGCGGAMQGQTHLDASSVNMISSQVISKNTVKAISVITYSVLETGAMARSVWCYLFNYIKMESLNNVIMMRSVVPFDKLTELIIL